MTITLADDPVRYARLKFAVVLPEGGDTTLVGDRVPVLKDAVLSVLSGYTAAELVGPDALVDLVDGGVDGSQLQDLRTGGGDEAAVGGAATRRQFRRQAGDFLDGLPHGID